MITPRPAAAPINRAFLAASSCAAISWYCWPTTNSFWGSDALSLFYGTVGGAFAIRGIRLLIADFRIRLHIKVSQKRTDDHGSAREATWEEIVSVGMDKPTSGNFIGLHANGHPVFYPPKSPFSLIEKPPGTNKTIAHVIESILHLAELGYSLFIPDPKCELAVMLAEGLRKRGIKVRCINPTKAYLSVCGNVELNPYQAVITAVYAKDETRKDASKIAADYAVIHVPENPNEKNPYFTFGSRRVVVFVILYLAVTDPANCTPTEVYRMIVDPTKLRKALMFAKLHLQTAVEDDKLLDFLKGEAANLLHREKENEENFSSFLEGATQRLLAFTAAGRLGGYGAGAIHDVAEMRNRQVVTFAMTPVSHLREFAPFVSLQNHNLLAACKTNPTGHPVRIVGEEALNYRLLDTADMETLRGMKVSADLYIQSFDGLVKNLGADAARAVESYADVKIYGGIASHHRAKHVSDMLSEATIRKQDYSYKSVVDSLNVSSRELGRRMMTASEVRAMPRDQVWVFVRGMNPMKLTSVHYGHGSPWRDQVSANPTEGPALRGELLFHIHYPKKGSAA